MYTNVLTCFNGLDSHVIDNNVICDAHNPIQHKSQKKCKPPPLDINQCWSTSVNPLVEFAAIATSPQSPLVQHYEHVVRDASTRDQLENCFESNQNETRPQSIIVRSSPPCFWDNSSKVDGSDLSWSPSVWQARSNNLPQDSFYENDSVINGKTNTDHITLEEEKVDRKEIINTRSLLMKQNNKARCSAEQFWSKSYFTESIPSVKHRDISAEFIFEKLCTPPFSAVQSSTNPDLPTKQSTTSVLFDLDSAAHALSNMAKRKEEYQRYCKTTNSIKRKVVETKRKRNEVYSFQAKRPMNSFMLFAKRYRLELTQKYPGKDNRAISVILGDQWKSLSYEDRKTYIMEAKILAEEHKRIYPDCWKRKRTQVSIGRNRKC